MADRAERLDYQTGNRLPLEMQRTPFLPHALIRLTLLAALWAMLFTHGYGNTDSVPPASVKGRVAQALTEKKAEERLKALAGIGASLTLPEMEDALVLANSFKELRAQAVFHDAAVKRWCLLAPAKAWAYVARLPEGRGKLELVRIASSAYAKVDPTSASKAAASSTGARSRIEAIAQVAEVWAKTDVPAALQWVRSLPSGPAREAALYNIRFIWVHIDPAAASEEIKQLPTDDTRKMLTMNIAGEWAARDPGKAIAWARTLTVRSEQEEAFSNIAESWADVSPHDAAEFALQLEPEFRTRVALAVIARWATQDPQAAANWALRTPDATVQNRGLAEVLNVWTSVYPASASQWVSTLTPLALRDATLQAYVAAVEEWAPDSATKMAAQISDPAVRWQRVQDSLSRWWNIDEKSAGSWLESTDLPAENKRQWLAAHGSG